MPDGRENSALSAHEPSETSPLLGDSTRHEDEHGPPEHEHEADDDTPIAEEPSTAKLMLTLGSVYFTVFLAALDSTIVATLSGAISSSFDSMKIFSWLATGYMIANAGFQPISGKLTDIYGRRAGLVFAVIFFAAGNLICGLATNAWVMILGRVISGIGGGCLNTISTFITTDLVPLRRRGIWQGVGNVCFGAGASIGGLFGGWMNDILHWRWAFLVQVPLTAVAGIIVFIMVKIPVKDSDTSRLKRVDFLGAFTLVASLVLLLVGVNSGGNLVPWNHPLVYTSLILSAVILAVFVYAEEKLAVEPIIPVRLLLNRTVGAGCLTNWLVTMAYFGYVYYAPIYFQAVRGLSTTEAGARLIPNAVGLAVGSMSSGLVMRATGKYYLLNVATEFLFVLAAALMLAFFNLNTPEWPAFIIFALAGTGYGAMLTITLIALISAVEHKDQAVITSASYAARSTGSSIGVSVIGAVFSNMLIKRLQEEFAGEKHADQIIKRLRDNILYIKMLPPALETKAIISYMDALKSVWVASLCLGTAGALVSLLMRQHKLHSNLARK